VLGLFRNKPTSGVDVIVGFGQYYVIQDYLARLTVPPPLPDRSNSIKPRPPDIASTLMDPENPNVLPPEAIVQLMPPGNLPPTEVLPPATRERGGQVQYIQSDTPAGADIDPLRVAVPV
jgi:hypothetical protein